MWRASPSPRIPFGFLNAVAAVSPSDVWAVGSHSAPDHPMRAHTLVEHWDGRGWHVLPDRFGLLYDVAALSSRDVWMVGTTTDTALKSRPLIEHWDGNRWLTMRGANAPATQLYGVAALSARDVWAVGGTFAGSNWATYTEHWDGIHWVHVASPPDQEPLVALAPFSATDVWAVGWSAGDNGDHEGIQHWDGTSWTVAITRHFRNPDNSYPTLSNVSGTSSNDIWAVGQAASAVLAEHWNGTTWRRVTIPFAHYASRYNAHNDSSLTGVAALSPTNVWMVGFGIEHWNGHSFTVSNVMKDGQLNDIAALSKNNLWAVGDDASNQPFILRYTCVRH